ncbi:hypothetical protein RI367_003282 [Sorochytrium milnesiophthora]
MAAHQPAFLASTTQALVSDAMDLDFDSSYAADYAVYAAYSDGSSSDSDGGSLPRQEKSSLASSVLNAMVAPSSPSAAGHSSPATPVVVGRPRASSRVQFAKHIQVEFTFTASEYDRNPIDPDVMTSKDLYEYQVMAFEMQQSIKFETTMRQLGLWDIPAPHQQQSQQPSSAPMSYSASSLPSPSPSPTSSISDKHAFAEAADRHHLVMEQSQQQCAAPRRRDSLKLTRNNVSRPAVLPSSPMVISPAASPATSPAPRKDSLSTSYFPVSVFEFDTDSDGGNASADAVVAGPATQHKKSSLPPPARRSSMHAPATALQPAAA